MGFARRKYFEKIQYQKMTPLQNPNNFNPNRPKAGIPCRYPNLGWWLIHLAGVSFVYYLGNRLWS
jgi:hypothetical protein